MASYAPLFAHVDAWQWTPNLIWTDNLRIYGTPDYYIQQLFSRNRGDAVLPIKFSAASNPQNNPKVYASAVRDDTANEVIIKLVNATSQSCEFAIQLDGASSVKPAATATVLTSEHLADENSLDSPAKVSPHSTSIRLQSPSFNQTVPANALMVLRVGL